MSNTIRMNAARKTELQLLTGVGGFRQVKDALAGGFNQAHKDVENVMLVDGDKPHTQKVGLKGLTMSSYSVGNVRIPSVSHKCAWTPEYIKMRHDRHQEAGNKGTPYIGHAGTHGILNNRITDDEGNTQNWGDGFEPCVKYQYAWQPHVEAGLLRFLRRKVTGALEHLSVEKLTHRQQRLISQNIMQVESALAYLKMDRALLHSDASKVVSKRANPYEHTHFILRSGSGYSDSDYDTYELLKLPQRTTSKPINMMQKAVKLMRNLYDAVSKSVTENRDSTHHASQLEMHRKSLLNYESQLQIQTDEAVAEWGSLEAAIKMDVQQRTEVIEYLKGLPHKHLLNMRSSNAITWFGNETEMTTIEPSPRFILGSGLEADIKSREETVERIKQSITTYEAKVAADASGLGDLKMQVAVGELKQFATAQGWIKPDITGGEEE